MPRDDHHPKEDGDALAHEAARCRRLADALTDSRTIETLRLMAQDYERRAGTSEHQRT